MEESDAMKVEGEGGASGLDLLALGLAGGGGGDEADGVPGAAALELRSLGLDGDCVVGDAPPPARRASGPMHMP
eukprot:2738533-Pyramimonas_sp.AAC.1